jgi:plasmid stability protein
MSLAEDKARILTVVNKNTKNRLQFLAGMNHRSLSNYVADILENHVVAENKKIEMLAENNSKNKS